MEILSEGGESLSREEFLGQFTGEIMREYFTMALEEPDAVLLIQIGKFYETMQMGNVSNHRAASSCLDIQLTRRNKIIYFSLNKLTNKINLFFINAIKIRIIPRRSTLIVFDNKLSLPHSFLIEHFSH